MIKYTNYKERFNGLTAFSRTDQCEDLLPLQKDTGVLANRVDGEHKQYNN